MCGNRTRLDEGSIDSYVDVVISERAAEEDKSWGSEFAAARYGDRSRHFGNFTFSRSLSGSLLSFQGLGFLPARAA